MQRSLPLSSSQIAAAALMALAALFQSCASQPATSARASAPGSAGSQVLPQDPSPFQPLKKGMSADEVRALFGTPVEVQPFSEANVKSEVWIYRRPVRTMATQAATSVQQVERVDPISGREFTVSEPVYQTVVVRVEETAKLLMIEGQLAEWKTTREVNRNF